MKQKIALIGTGVSGLSCLYFFLKKSADKIEEVEIFEKGPVVGGVLAHTQKNGFILEHGAQGVLSSRKNFSLLISELNLTQSISSASPKKAHRSFFVKNQIVRISPKNIVQMFQVNLLSFYIVFRILFEFFIQKPKSIIANETVEDFFSRRFGKKISLNFLTPVMKGIWGGGISRILVRFAFPELQIIEQNERSLLKSFFKNTFFSKKRIKKEMLSFETGMAVLPQKILEAIQEICTKKNIIFKLRLNQDFNESIVDKKNLRQNVNNQDASKKNRFDLVLYSGQPWKENKFPFENHEAIISAFEILKKIPTHTLVVVGIGSSNLDIQHRLDGFGALAVENNEEGVLGVICVHSLNPAHVPPDSFLYRVILGGENIPSHLHLETCNHAEIIQLAKKYLQKYQLLNTEKTYAFENVVRHINYLPLPTAYQEQVLEAVSVLERLMPGVFFVGNYLMGPAVDACIAQAHVTADKMSAYCNDVNTT